MLGVITNRCRKFTQDEIMLLQGFMTTSARSAQKRQGIIGIRTTLHVYRCIDTIYEFTIVKARTEQAPPSSYRLQIIYSHITYKVLLVGM